MVLAELQNWQECRTAVLEYENDSIYLYNHPHHGNPELKSLWIANTKRRWFGKSDIKSDMDKGLQPYMPKEDCNESGYIKDFKNSGNWELQWGLDQNSIAVSYQGKIIAIMPEWSGVNGFYGYSAGVMGETPLAWPLKDDNIQINRFLKEKEFLESWSESTWITHQERLLKAFDALYSGESRYFAADEGKWPPLGIHYCNTGDTEFMATVGMSQLPMPEYGMPHEEPEEFRRIELAMACRPISDFQPLAQYLSGQSTYPWNFGSHFDHGHTMPCEQLREVGSNASFVAFVDKAKFLPEVLMPSFEGNSVRLLFMLPIYESEQRYAEEKSTQELLKIIENECEDPFDLFREAIV